MKRLLCLSTILMASLISMAQVIRPANPTDSSPRIIVSPPPLNLAFDDGIYGGIGSPTFCGLYLARLRGDSINIEAWPASGIRIVKDTLILDNPSFHFIKMNGLTYSLIEISGRALQFKFMQREAEKRENFIDILLTHGHEYRQVRYEDQQPRNKLLPRPVYCKATGLWAVLSGTEEGHAVFWGLASPEAYNGVPGTPAPILKRYLQFVIPPMEATFPDMMSAWIEIRKWEMALQMWTYQQNQIDSIEKAKHTYQ